MHPRCHPSALRLSLFLLLFCLFPLSLFARPFILVLSQEDLKDAQSDDASPLDSDSSWDDDDFGGTHVKPDDELDPGSWRRLFEPATTYISTFDDSTLASYYAAVDKMISASTDGDARMMEEAAAQIETAANPEGDPHAGSVLGFLYGMGMMRERNKAKAFLNHYFAAEGGSAQSVMALAYTYSRQDMYEKAVKLYAEFAEITFNIFLISKDSPVIEPIRIHNGAEEGGFKEVKRGRR